VPLRFQGNNIVIPVTVTLPDGTQKEIESVIDTGSSGALSFRSGFSPDVGKTIAAQGYGVGGRTETSIGRISALAIGPYILREPIVELSHAKGGTESGCAVPSSIGERILSRFTVYLDYAHERLILEPNAHLGDRFDYDMSGLDLRVSDGRAKIVSVRAGSAGANAGLKPGDVIAAAGGRKIAAAALPTLQERFRRASDLAMTIHRGGETLHLVVHLRREV
jgi:membrane-associated protease RseP (regulator of RpoE activity)